MAKTVLVVESNTPVRMLCEEILREKGYYIIAVPDASRAFDALNETVPAAVIGNLIGQEAFYKRLREQYSAVPVVLMSGSSGLESFAERYGIKHIIKKPFNDAQLIGALEAALAEVPQ